MDDVGRDKDAVSGSGVFGLRSFLITVADFGRHIQRKNGRTKGAGRCTIIELEQPAATSIVERGLPYGPAHR